MNWDTMYSLAMSSLSICIRLPLMAKIRMAGFASIVLLPLRKPLPANGVKVSKYLLIARITDDCQLFPNMVSQCNQV